MPYFAADNDNVKNKVFIMQVSLFNGFADKNPKPITIREVVEIIRADQRLQVLTENHRRYRAMGDTARADAEKNHMPCYSVAVLFSGGKQQKHIVSYTGLSIVDLDHIPSERMAEVLEKVRGDEHTLMAYTTISGEGVRVITRFALNAFNDNVNDNDNCHPAGNTAEPKSSSSSSFSLIWKELEDKHVNSLYCRFCLETGRQAKISDFYIIIESDFYPDYHPLKEYLESLPAWDGTTDHIDQLASTVHVTGCTQELHNRFFKKWMVAMVAAWLDDGTTNHEILTYIGEQGKYKTSFMTHLLPPALDKYFAIKHFSHSMSKDDRLALTELALIDLEELDNMRPEAVNLLKAITTDPAINLRPVWERYALRRQHIASFCGTGNNPRFLTDLSGNRRWLAFMVDSIDSPWERTTDYDGIYAQAYALWQQGFRYWFDDEENAELEQHNRQFEEPNMEEELILTYLRQPYGDEAGEFLTATRIIELIGMYVKCPLSPKRVAFAMNRLGYRQRRVGGVRGYNVIILTGNDIKEQQRLNARESTINE